MISDLIAKHVLNWIDPNFVEYSWLDRGSDERQYCAPGIDLPIWKLIDVVDLLKSHSLIDEN